MNGGRQRGAEAQHVRALEEGRKRLRSRGRKEKVKRYRESQKRRKEAKRVEEETKKEQSKARVKDKKKIPPSHQVFPAGHARQVTNYKYSQGKPRRSNFFFFPRAKV